MRIVPVTDPEFAAYGRVLDGDYGELLQVLRSCSDRPSDHVIYVPSEPALEALPIYPWLSSHVYGGMPVEIGYCNGANRDLNCLEYHRGSEVNVAADDVVLLLALRSEMDGWALDTDKVRAFLVPVGTAVLVYETTLHYAPCSREKNGAFRVAVALPRDTNLSKPELTGPHEAEDDLLWARNKWLLAHPESAEASQGAFVGLRGNNIHL